MSIGANEIVILAVPPDAGVRLGPSIRCFKAFLLPPHFRFDVG